MLTTYFSARIDLGVVRQESSPQSATNHSATVSGQLKCDTPPIKEQIEYGDNKLRTKTSEHTEQKI